MSVCQENILKIVLLRRSYQMVFKMLLAKQQLMSVHKQRVSQVFLFTAMHILNDDSQAV